VTTTTALAPLPDRLPVLDRLVLSHGGHQPADLLADPTAEACLLEVTAYLAGEPWSAEPRCTSPVLTEFGLSLNDAWDDSARQQLAPFAARLIGTRDGQDEARSLMALDWLCRSYAPAWLRLVPALVSDADALAGLPMIVDLETAAQIGEAVREIVPKAQAAYSAARSAAYWAAGSAAYSAAYSAADSAADSAARSAAGSAAYSAAYSAADSAARSAARSAAGSAAYWAAYWAAGSALAPTVEALQASALDLLDRMLDPSAVPA